MDIESLDTAFMILISHDVPFDPESPYVDLDERRLHELRRLIPNAEQFYRQAQNLLELACEWADQFRGTNNDFSGPLLDATRLEARFPGFSRKSYEAAVSEAFMRTK